MERKIEKSFHSQTRLKTETRIELFNRHYLHFQSKALGKRRTFDIEVATLDPQAQHINNKALHWLAATTLVLLVNVYFILQLVTQFSTNGLLTLLGSLLITGALAAVFFVLYRRHSERKWLFSTRTARYPLIEIPYTKQQTKEVKAFVEHLQAMIEGTVQEKRYQEEDLFAGEMRMLRRLAKNQVLSLNLYEKARERMLKRHGTTVGATG